MTPQRWWTALVCVAGLLGPLLLTELWTRRQLDLLYPHLLEKPYWTEAKLMVMERVGCPDLLALGSSVTNRTLVAELVRNQPLPFPDGLREAKRPFAFGLDGSSVGVAYAVWQHVDRRGCVPTFLFIEALPVTLREGAGHVWLLRPVLDVQTQLRMPSGFLQTQGLGAGARTRMATWDRLLLHRVRGPLRAALGERWEHRADSGVPTARIAEDGRFNGLSSKRLTAQRYQKERQRRERIARTGQYDRDLAPLQVESLKRLVRDARTAGSRVILHSPPVTALYREIVERAGFRESLCALRHELTPAAGYEWYWSFGGDDMRRSHFADWLHLNRHGGRRYVERLFAAIRSGRTLDDDWCDTR